MIWIVSGGRKFADITFVFNSLDRIADQYGLPELLRHGNARGVDSLAELWAQSVGVETDKNDADWDQYDNAAGPIRNTEMLEKGADIAIFFPGGRGTNDMYLKAHAAGLEIITFNSESLI